MLARLEAIPGVTGPRVDATGRFFLFPLAPGAAEADVLGAALAALGRGARRLDAAAAAAQLAAVPRGDPWYDRAGLLGLCYLEARVIANRAATDVGAAAGLEPAEREALDGAARAVLFAAMDRVMGEGGRPSSGWFHAEWPALAAEITRRCLPALAPGRREAAVAALARLHAA